MVKKSKMDAAVDRFLARLDFKKAARRHNQQVAAMMLRTRRDKEKRIAKAALLRPKRKRVRQLELAGWKMLCCRMQDDTWYEFSELRALIPEFARGSAKAWTMNYLPKTGRTERAGHPAFDPGAKRGSKTQARYLHKLTDKGAREAAQWRLQIGL